MIRESPCSLWRDIREAAEGGQYLPSASKVSLSGCQDLQGCPRSLRYLGPVFLAYY